MNTTTRRRLRRPYPQCAAHATGPPLRPQDCCASLTRRPCGPVLTPEPLRPLKAGNTGRPGPPSKTRSALDRSRHRPSSSQMPHPDRPDPVPCDWRENGPITLADDIALVPIVIACAAFAFSVFTWQERAAKDRRDLFLKLHERLNDIDLQRGRRILAERIKSIEDAATLLHDSPNDYELVFRALAMYDVAALYAERGYIDRKLFLEDWDGSYARAWEHGQHVIAERLNRLTPNSWSDWPHFQRLGRLSTERIHSFDRH